MSKSDLPKDAQGAAQERLDFERARIGQLISYALELIAGDAELMTISWAFRGLEANVGDRSLASREHMARTIVIVNAYSTGDATHDEGIPAHRMDTIGRKVIMVVCRHHQKGAHDEAFELLHEYVNGNPEKAYADAMAFLGQPVTA